MGMLCIKRCTKGNKSTHKLSFFNFNYFIITSITYFWNEINIDKLSITGENGLKKKFIGYKILLQLTHPRFLYASRH